MGITSSSYTPKEIRARKEDDSFHSISVTIVAEQSAVLDVGTVLGKVTASGKYGPYAADSATAGLEKAVAILAERVDATGTADVNAKAFTSGYFIAAQLTGMDAGAKVEMDVKTLPNGDLKVEGSSN